MYLAFAADVIGFPLSFKESAKIVAAQGYSGYWFNIGRDSETSAAETRELLDRYRLAPAGFGLPVNFRADEETFRRDLEKLPAYTRFAAEVGLRRCMTWIMPGSDTLTYRENFALHSSRLSEVAAVLSRGDVSLGLEFVGPYTKRAEFKHEFLHTLDGALELAAAIRNGHTGVVLDIFHWDTSEETAAGFAKIASEKDIILVHLNDAPALPMREQLDNVRGLPGATGVLRYGEFFAGLKGLGYQGPAVVEPFYPPLSALGFTEAAKAVYDAAMKIWPPVW